MAQSVLRYNVVIVGKFFNKGSWVSEAWKKEHTEGCENECDGPPERIATAEERRELLHLDQDPECAVCVRSSGTPPPHGVRLTSAGRGNPNQQNVRTTLPTKLIPFVCFQSQIKNRKLHFRRCLPGTHHACVECFISAKVGELEWRLSTTLSGCAKDASVRDKSDAPKELLAGVETRFREEHAALVDATNELKTMMNADESA